MQNGKRTFMILRPSRSPDYLFLVEPFPSLVESYTGQVRDQTNVSLARQSKRIPRGTIFRRTKPNLEIPQTQLAAKSDPRRNVAVSLVLADAQVIFQGRQRRA